MPFTLAHPGAVLSLMKGPLVPTALVAGFVTPDVSYVIRVPVSAHSWHRQFLNATDTHAVLSGFTLGLPLAIALLALYWFVRQPVSTLIPPCFRFAPPPAGWPHWGADWSLRNWLALGEHFPSLTCDRQPVSPIKGTMVASPSLHSPVTVATRPDSQKWAATHLAKPLPHQSNTEDY